MSTRRLVSDGIWTWYNDPRAIERNGALYAGFVRANGDVVVTKTELSTGARTLFVLAAAFEVDDHDNPGLAFLPDGRLFAAYSKHGGTGQSVRCRISTSAEDITAWGAEATIPNVTPSGTDRGSSYANPWILPDDAERLFVHFRGANWLPVLTYSDDDGATWSTPRELFHDAAVGGRPYVKSVSDGAGRLHFLASSGHPQDVSAGSCHLWHWYYDASDGNFHTSDGTTIRSLASLATTGKLTTSEVTKVYDATSHSGGGNGNAWPWSIELDASAPVVAYGVFQSIDDNDYHYARWTGPAWDRHTVLSGQGSLYGAGDTAEDQYSGGVAIDPTDTTRLLLSNDTSGQWEIEEWETADGGANWTTTAVTSGSSVKNFRPAFVRDGGGRALWCRGTYTDFDTYATDVWATPAVQAPSFRSLLLSMFATGAYLTLDETVGATADNLVGTDGTYVNAPALGEAAAIAEGSAVLFNGTDERVDLPDLGAAENSQFTYLCFFRSTQTGIDRWLISEGSTVSNTPLCGLILQNGAVRGFLRGATTGSNVDATTAVATYNDGAYHFAVLTWDNGTLSIYVDGALGASTTGAVSARALDTTTIAALRRAAVGLWANATIDEAAILPGVTLTSEQVAELWEARDVPPVATIQPTAIGSGEAVGTPTVAASGGPETIVQPDAIASGEAAGDPLVLSPRKVVPTGIASPDATGIPTVGTPTVGRDLKVRFGPGHRGVPSAEAVGTPAITLATTQPEGIPSGEAVGTPTFVYPQTVEPSGVASAEVPGEPSIGRPETVVPTGIGPGDAGVPSIIRAGAIEPTGIASSEALGTPELVTLEQLVLPAPVASAEATGAVVVVRETTHLVVPTGIASQGALGPPVLLGGAPGPVVPTSIPSGERFGLPRITVGVPQGPVAQPPGRIANRLYDPETGVAFAWAINHSVEDPRSYERQYEAGAPTTVGLSRQQSAGEPFRLSFRGTLLDPAQKADLDALFVHCDANTLIYEDYSGEAYEVIVASWDCRPERGRNPVTRGLHLWRYTIELFILRTLHGAVHSVIGNPPATPPDITVTVPPLAKQPVGIASRGAMGAPTILGGDIVLVPTAIRPTDAFGLVVVTGGTPPGGGGPGEGGGSSIPAAFPSRLEASGTTIVDSNGYILRRMTGVNLHCLPTYIPSQTDLHDIKGTGASWVRIVLHWRDLEPTAGTFNSTMRSQLDTLLARCRTAGLYAMLELHLNVGAVPSWTSGTDETAKYANGGEFITGALAARYGSDPVVMGFGLNETPLGDSTIRNGNNAIPYLEGVQRDMISWFRVSAPDWIGFPTLGYANQTPYPDAPRTPASPTAYDAVGGNVVIDVHHYQAGVNSSDPSHDGRQPNGTIYPTYQGGLAYWQISDYPLSYVDTATHRAQIAAFLADYVTYCNAAQIPLMVGEVGWAANNTGGKAAWWAAVLAALKGADTAMVAQWIYAYGVPPQEYWAARPGGTWEPGVLSLLSGVW